MFNQPDLRCYSSSSSTASSGSDSSHSNNSNNRRLFVSNLAHSVSGADLRLHMESVGGNVVDAPLFGEDGGSSSKGSAVVEFATAQQARHALQTLPNTTLQGRRIQLRCDQRQQPSYSSDSGGSSSSSLQQQSDCKVYIDNVPESAQWQELKDWVRSVLLLPSSCDDDTASNNNNFDSSVVRSANVWVDAETGRRLGVVLLDRPESVDDLLLATSTMMRRADPSLLLMGQAVTVRRPATDVLEEAGLVLCDEVMDQAETTKQSPSTTALGVPPASMVYVGNLPPSTTWPQLKDHMRRAGAVRSANVYPDNTTDYDPGCLFGLVLYHDAQDAFRAIDSLDGSSIVHDHGGNDDDDDHNQFGMISVRPATPADVERKGNPIETTRSNAIGAWNESSSVYVTNLAGSVRWQDLKDFMRLAGGAVRSANVYHDDGAEMYGVVLFANPRDAAQAVERLNGRELAGLPVQLYSAREYSLQQEQNSSNSTNQRPFRNNNDPCKVYVSNLPERATWQQLKDHMRGAGGHVRSANVDGRGRGVVLYLSPQDAARAVHDLNHSSLLGQPIVVRSSSRDRDSEEESGERGVPDVVPRQFVANDDFDQQQHRQRNDHSETAGTVYVTNLPPHARWQEVKDFLRQAGGTVSSVNVYRNNADNDDSGGAYGVAKFRNPRDAGRAISLLNGRPLSGAMVQVSDHRPVGPSDEQRHYEQW